MILFQKSRPVKDYQMPLGEMEKKELLRIAREAIEARAGDRKPPDPVIGSASLNEDSGAFVSLHKNGRLRGCIGVFASKDPLWKTVRNMAGSAAALDPRFAPVEAGELPQIDIEISVLSPLREIRDMNGIEVGRHGIYVTQGRSSGCLLPQVAVEHGFDRDAFLAETCVKAGLRPDAWKKGASVCIFEAEVFREKELLHIKGKGPN